MSVENPSVENLEEGQEIDHAGPFNEWELVSINDMLNFSGGSLNLEAANKIVDKAAVRKMFLEYGKLRTEHGKVSEMRKLEGELIEIVDNL